MFSMWKNEGRVPPDRSNHVFGHRYFTLMGLPKGRTTAVSVGTDLEPAGIAHRAFNVFVSSMFNHFCSGDMCLNLYRAKDVLYFYRVRRPQKPASDNFLPCHVSEKAFQPRPRFAPVRW